ncbi:MAG: divergent polysaccharide deacetylase family protein [Alphaproteobacteria bacterium]|nr:divergent polysaccharide deacetylase family protein [Alphaproteobacteria bacterium]
MKKSPFKKKLKIAFWVVFALGCLWVAYAPPTRLTPPPSVTVKVQQPPPLPTPEAKAPAPQPALGGEEQTPQAPAVHNEAVTVPVAPEKEEKIPSGRKLKIAIVIDDVGPDLTGSEKAIKLPPAVTLSFLPYAARVREEAKEARDDGHELLLHMPMEPVGHEYPGQGALLVDLPMRDLQQRFENALASFTGFDGVNNHMGSKFTAWPEGMTMVVDELQQRHLFFLDSRTSAQSVGLKTAEAKGLPAIGRDVFLDDDQSPDAIRKQLDITERIARRKGYAVAIGHPHAATMAVLGAWTGEAAGRGVELVPLRDLVKANSD